MKRMLYYCFAVFAVLALTPCAFADTVNGAGSWQSWVVGDVNNNGVPYWDNLSSDGTQMNIGYLLTGTQSPGPGIAGFPGNIPYYGTSGGAAVSNFNFISGGSSQAAIQIEVAGMATTNVFGWYYTPTVSPVRTQLFSGPQTTGATAVFTPPTGFNYGFYIGTTTDNGATYTYYYTQSSLNPAGDTNFQHFALFDTNPTGNGTYWLGMEDLPYASSDKDYNDMVVTVRPVPIPAAVWLLGSGLLGLAGIRRRLRK